MDFNTPIMSAYPDHWHEIQRRHFISTAKATNFSVTKANMLINEMVSKIDTVISEVTAILPKGFPKVIADSVFQGMKEAKRKLTHY